MKKSVLVIVLIVIAVGAYILMQSAEVPQRGPLNEQEQAVDAYYRAVETGDVQKTLDASRGMVDGLEQKHALGVAEDAETYADRGGIESVDARCSEPKKLDLPKETWLSSCSATLYMKDGSSIDQGISRVSKIDGSWKFVL